MAQKHVALSDEPVFWSASFGVSTKKAQRYGKHLLALEAKNGCITPELVLKDAERERSPIHEFFEWDNTKAAAAYRLVQARVLIRVLVFVYEDQDRKPTKVRAFVSVREGDGQSYVSLAKVNSDPVMLAEVTKRALGELDGFQRRYEQFAHLSTVMKAVARAALELQADLAIPVLATRQAGPNPG